jgi:hypothetical protein
MLFKVNFAIAIFIVIIGVLTLLPSGWLRWDGLVLGIIAAAPILTLLYIVAGGSIAATLWHDRRFGHSHPDHRLSRIFGVLFAVLAIVGFVSGEYWLGLFHNSYLTALLYALFASYFLFWGFFRDHEKQGTVGNPADRLKTTTTIQPQSNQTVTPSAAPTPPAQP